MRVLYLSNSAQIGGGNRSLLGMAEHVRSLGIDPAVVCPAEGAMSQAVRAAGIACHVIPTFQPSLRQPIQSWTAYRNWCKLMRETKPAVIHANDPSTARAIGIAAKKRHVPLISHVRFPLGTGFTNWAWRRVPAPALFVFNSASLRNEMWPALSAACPHASHEVLHNAVDLSQFQPASRRSDASRVPVVGILANLIPVKGHEDFLSMAKLLVDRGNDIKLSVFGADIHNTGYGDKLQALAIELGISDRVHFHGFVADVPTALSQLDVLVVPSHVEPFGRAAIEGMACQLPVVATRIGGLPEVIVDGITGYLVEPRAPKQLADSVQRLLDSRELCEHMGTTGRRRVIDHFDLPNHARRVIELYERVLQRH